ncbi:c-type cytochrome [Malikia granosa]|uniref:Cytochrome C n=1 Tax=Malikia granosa TaxID=263067 RepID=A0A2S9K507_9BURK|nr:c-type cytochrome [Malikia granosa]PRD65543.1 cytochrome C [Malikia granosa]
MKKLLTLAALAAFSTFGLQAHASSGGEKLVQHYLCLGCHAVDKASIGPSFQQIASAWRGKPEAEKTLVTTVRQGSSAAGGPHWGQVKMPDDSERAQISERDAKRMVHWILKQ